MPNIKSQEKRDRNSKKRAAVVKSEKTKIKNAIKTVRKAVESNDTEAANTALKGAYSVLDASIGKGIHHKNYAKRTKSRLSKAVNKLSEDK